MLIGDLKIRVDGSAIGFRNDGPFIVQHAIETHAFGLPATCNNIESMS